MAAVAARPPAREPRAWRDVAGRLAIGVVVLAGIVVLW
jgi:hypothetical protein